MSLKERVEEKRKATASAFVTWDVIDIIVEEIEKQKPQMPTPRKRRKTP